jgi:putative ABC transport system permease protein
MELWIGAFNLGLLYAFLAIGTLITGRILKFNDITVDGSFTTGAAVSAILIANGWDPFLSLAIASMVGAIAGAITGVIHTSLKVDSLLAGILVMIALYSINLHIMGRSNIPLINAKTVFTSIDTLNPGLPTELWLAIALLAISVVLWLLVSLFFKTDLGITVQSAGDNKIMTSASGVNVNKITIFGVMFANAFVGFSGGLIAQYQGFADIGMGIGSLIIGLASVIIGETIFRSRNIFVMIGSAFIGSIIYRYMIAFALWVGMNPIDLKLITAFFVLLTLIVTKITKKSENPSHNLIKYKIKKNKGKLIALLICLLLIPVLWFVSSNFMEDTGSKSVTDNMPKKYKIGVIQLSDNSLLNITRDAFYAEMKRMGILDSCEILFQDANGDVQLANQIIANFQVKKVDAIISFSTPTTQAAMGRVKDTPIIFGTVANPFLIKAGTSDSVHLPNVTGTYGAVDMKTLLNMVCSLYNRKIRIGAIWDPGHANAVYNVENLRKAIAERNDVVMEGVTITGSADVQEAAETICNKKLDAIVLPPDNIVYNAIESVIKVADKYHIPVFSAEASALKRGVSGTYGYDYTESGIKVAHILKKVLRGTSPKDIPFEEYKLSYYGFNKQRLAKFGLKIPPKYEKLMRRYVDEKGEYIEIIPTIGMVQFSVEPMVEFCKVGIFDAMAERGFVEGANFKILYKNANGDFNMISQIMQDLNRRGVDIIVPLSTPVVQGAIQAGGGNSKTKVVYTYTYNPFAIGAAKTTTDHLPWATGSACPPKLDVIFNTFKKAFPNIKRYGVVYNSSEANSNSVMIKMREEAKRINVELIEMTATSSAEVMDAANALANKKVQLFIAPGDNTVNLSIDAYAKVAKKFKVPLLSFDTDHASGGYAVLACGSSYYQTGYEAGDYIVRVLLGEDPAKMPVIMTQKMDLIINDSLAKACGIKINKSVYKDATKVVKAIKATKAIKKKVVTKYKRKMALLLFNENPVLFETRDGIKSYLKKTGILEKNKIKLVEFNAQGEFAIAQSITQKLIEDKYDYILTCSTPVLQVVSNFNKTIPHIFGAVTDPYRMGVAKSSTDHQANLTGVATFQPMEQIVLLVKEMFPKARRIGIVYNSAEASSEACMGKLRIAAKKHGFILKEKTITATGEVLEAVNSLISDGIDVFITAGDNSVKQALSAVIKVADRNSIPCFTENPYEVKNGITAALGANYFQVGLKVGEQAEKVINGVKPKHIPINNYCPNAVGMNLKLIQKYKGKMPSEQKCKAALVLVK